jgi:predicted DNA-binding transcriptional regulator AlpA
MFLELDSWGHLWYCVYLNSHGHFLLNVREGAMLKSMRKAEKCKTLPKNLKLSGKRLYFKLSEILPMMASRC